MRTKSDVHDGYHSELLLAWCLRFILLLSGLAILATLGACKNGGDIDLTLKGSAVPKTSIERSGSVN